MFERKYRRERNFSNTREREKEETLDRCEWGCQWFVSSWLVFFYYFTHTKGLKHTHTSTHTHTAGANDLRHTRAECAATHERVRAKRVNRQMVNWNSERRAMWYGWLLNERQGNKCRSSLMATEKYLHLKKHGSARATVSLYSRALISMCLSFELVWAKQDYVPHAQQSYSRENTLTSMSSK